MQPNHDTGINQAGELLALINLAESLQKRSTEFGAELAAILAGAAAEDLKDTLFEDEEERALR